MKLILKSSAAQPLVFLLISSTDHISGLTGLGSSVTVTISKNGGSFAAPSGAISEIGNGWYQIAANATDSNTLGPLLIHATGTGADPCDERYDVVAFNPQSATNLGLSALPTANPAANGGLGICDANGAVPASLIEIMGTLLTGTAANVAAAFSTMFNVSSSSFTTASKNQTGDSYAIVNSGTYGNTALLTALGTPMQAGTTVGANVTEWLGSAVQTPSIAGVPAVYLVGGASNSLDGYLFTADAQAVLSGFWIAGKTTTTPPTNAVFGTAYNNSTASTIYDGKPLYESSGGTYLWWDSTNSVWTLSLTPGTRGMAYFTATSLTGTWTAGGSATGTPSLVFSPLALFAVDPNGYSYISSGTGSGQLNVTSGIVNSNVTEINGQTANASGAVTFPPTIASTTNITAATVTTVSGNVNGSVASVTGSVGSVTGNVGGNVSGSVGSCPDTSGTTTLLNRLTSSRAAYLDNLNVGGNVASHADIAAINQSASRTLVVATVGQYSQGETYSVDVRTYSTSTGLAVNADSTPTLTATGSVSGSLSSNLASATNPDTGHYLFTYTVPSSPNLEQITFAASATIDSVTYKLSAYTQVVDQASAIWSATQAGQLAAVYNKLPPNNIADETLVLTALPAIDGSGRVLLQPAQEGVTIPIVTSVTNSVNANVTDIGGAAVSTTLAQIGVNVVQYNSHSAQTDANNLPKVDLEDIVGAAVNTSAAQLGVNVVSGRSSGGPTAAQIATAVWQDTTSDDFAVSGSPGAAVTSLSSKLPTNQIADETALLAAIGSPFQASNDFNAAQKASLNAATPAGVTGSVGSVIGNVGGNVIGTVGSVVANVNTNANSTELAIADKTDNLPFDPASQSAIFGAIPTPQAIRQEMDTNSTKLASAATTSGLTVAETAILSAIGTAFPSGGYTEPPTAAEIAQATASVLFVDGGTNQLKVNPDHTVIATVEPVSAGNSITIPAAMALASQNPTIITCLRGDTLRVVLPQLGNLGSDTKLVMTAKANINDSDEQAVFQIIEGIGLTCLNGNTSTNPSAASLTIVDSTNGTIDLEIDASVTAEFAVIDLVWDVQVYLPTGIVTPVIGTFSVVADVTQAVT